MFRWIFAPYMAPDGDDGGSGGGDDNSGDVSRKSLLDGVKPDSKDGTSADDGNEGTWAWGENVPGTGTVPPWFNSEKYTSISEQAKAATALAEKLGPAVEMLGAPEENYSLPEIPEGIDGEWDAKDPMLVKFMEVAKDAGLSQVAFNKLVGPMAQLIGEETAASETAISDAISEIGTNAEQRMDQVETYLRGMLGDEAYEPLNDAIGTDVKAYLALEALVAKASGDAQLSSLPGKTGPGFSRADIEAEQYKKYPSDHKLAGKVIYEHDKEHRAKVDSMWKELFPGEDRQEVG